MGELWAEFEKEFDESKQGKRGHLTMTYNDLKGVTEMTGPNFPVITGDASRVLWPEVAA